MDLIDRLQNHLDQILDFEKEVDRASLSADLIEARMELRTLRAAYARARVNVKSSGECSICGGLYTDYGHNAQPVNDGRCCVECNSSVVIPARIEEFLT
jgi:hypothetical protein